MQPSLSDSARPEVSEHRVRMRFITSTPLNVVKGSGTFIGIKTLAMALRRLGVTVELVTPRVRFPILTLRRLIFNRMLSLHSEHGYHVTVGFDMDGYTLAGLSPGLHVASIKGVIADEMRFETGITKATMQVQAACERQHIRQADIVVTTSQYSSARVQELYGISKGCHVLPEPINLSEWRSMLRLDQPQPDPGFCKLGIRGHRGCKALPSVR